MKESGEKNEGGGQEEEGGGRRRGGEEERRDVKTNSLNQKNRRGEIG